MDDCLPTMEVFSLPVGGGTVLRVIYTNEERALESALANFERWIEPEKHKFLGPCRCRRANRHAQTRPRVPLVRVALDRSWTQVAARFLFNKEDHVRKRGHEGRQEGSCPIRLLSATTVPP